jgi:beta-galactosidase beta subunit
MIVDMLTALENYGLFSRDLRDAMASCVETVRKDPTPRREALRDTGFFALVQENALTPPDAAVIEAHADFADVHVPVSAPETLLFSPLGGLTLLEDRRPGEDTLLYRCNPGAASHLVVQSGFFAFFRPGEGHAPCLARDGAEGGRLAKIVFKIHRDLFAPRGKDGAI